MSENNPSSQTTGATQPHRIWGVLLMVAIVVGTACFILLRRPRPSDPTPSPFASPVSTNSAPPQSAIVVSTPTTNTVNNANPLDSSPPPATAYVASALPSAYSMYSQIPTPFKMQTAWPGQGSLANCVAKQCATNSALCSGVLYDPAQDLCWTATNMSSSVPANASSVSLAASGAPAQNQFSTASQYAVQTGFTNPANYAPMSWPSNVPYRYYWNLPSSPAQCATWCNQPSNANSQYPCTGFAWDPSTQNCYMSASYTGGGNSLFGSPTLYYQQTSPPPA